MTMILAISVFVSTFAAGVVIGWLLAPKPRRDFEAAVMQLADDGPENDVDAATRDGVMGQTREEVFSEVRLVRDFLHLLWDMAVRWHTWDWKTAKASFGFYREAAIFKFRHIFW